MQVPASQEFRDDKVPKEHRDFLRLIAPLTICVCSSAVFVIAVVLHLAKKDLLLVT